MPTPTPPPNYYSKKCRCYYYYSKTCLFCFVFSPQTKMISNPFPQTIIYLLGIQIYYSKKKFNVIIIQRFDFFFPQTKMMYNPCPQIIIYLLGLCIATHYKCDDEMTQKKRKKKKGLHLKTLLFSDIYIEFKLYKRSSNYHPR